VDCQLLDNCYLGWFFTVRCPLRGRAAEEITKEILVHQKQVGKKAYIGDNAKLQNNVVQRLHHLKNI
jgi:hypothetical protein